MKSLIIIYCLAVLVFIAGFAFMNCCIDLRVEEFKHTQWYKLPSNTQTQLHEAVRASDSVVELNYDMQPFGVSAEDEYTAQLAVQGTDYLQVTEHYAFLQNTDNVQSTQDVRY